MSELLANEAAAALASGCQLVSVATPAIDGTYAVDEENLNKLSRVALYVEAFGAFPKGQTTWTIIDLTGAARVFPSTTVFLSTLRGIADYVAALEEIVDGIDIISTSLPSQPITVP